MVLQIRSTTLQAQISLTRNADGVHDVAARTEIHSSGGHIHDNDKIIPTY